MTNVSLGIAKCQELGESFWADIASSDLQVYNLHTTRAVRENQFSGSKFTLHLQLILSSTSLMFRGKYSF